MVSGSDALAYRCPDALQYATGMQYGAIPTSMAERIALAAGLVPIPVLDTLFGMLKARCVMAGVRLGIFEALAQEPRSAASIAAALRLDESCLDLLLRTLVYCGYLVLDGERFALSPLGRKSMVSGAPRELTGFVQWNYTQWEFAGHLETLVRTGKGLEFHETLERSEAWGHYQKAMLETARFDAPVLARHVPVRAGATPAARSRRLARADGRDALPQASADALDGARSAAPRSSTRERWPPAKELPTSSSIGRRPARATISAAGGTSCCCRTSSITSSPIRSSRS